MAASVDDKKKPYQFGDGRAASAAPGAKARTRHGLSGASRRVAKEQAQRPLTLAAPLPAFVDPHGAISSRV